MDFKQCLTVFISQYLFILLKGMQQINVVEGRYKQSIAISLGLGICGLLTLGIITTAIVSGGSWLVYASYLAAGPSGIVTAIWLEGEKRQ